MITTARLDLIALSPLRLQLYRERPEELEDELEIRVSRTIVTDIVKCAIDTKLTKMAQADPCHWEWFTYWLMVLQTPPFGAGLIGFKGYPDAAGEVEIGYGIDPLHQNRGYASEAARAMIAWAFAEPACRCITAKQVRRDNLASQHVLRNCGMSVYVEKEATLDFRIDRVPQFHQL